jgi:predicted MFS family arabinose efflux permease
MPPSRCDGCHLALSLIAAVAVSCYTTVAPILPLEMHARGLSDGCASLVFLASTVGSLVAPSLAVNRFESVGTVNVMACSMAGMSLMFWSLGCAFDIDAHDGMPPKDDPPPTGDEVVERAIAVVGMLMFVQFFLGASFSVISTGYYSLATSIFIDRESAMSSVEAACGIGYIIGPIFGSALYDAVGYHRTYGAISLGLMIMSLLTLKFLVPRLQYGTNLSDDGLGGMDSVALVVVVVVDGFVNYDTVDKSEIDITAYDRSTSGQAPSAISLLGFPKVLLAALTMCWISVSWALFEPLLAIRLSDYFHVGTGDIGMIFALTSIAYVPAVYLSQYLPRHGGIGRRRTISISVVLSAITVMLMGSDSFPVLMLGTASRGMLQAPVWVHLLPWMQEESLKRFPDPGHEQLVNDLTASLYNSSMKLGQVVGYSIGPLMTSLGFARTTRAVALLMCFQSVLFYFGTGDYDRGRRGDSVLSSSMLM